MNELYNHFSKMASIPIEEWQKAIRIFRPVVLNKGEFFEGQGQIATKIAFIKKGLLREYFSLQNGKEFNKAFKSENQFSSHFRSLLLQTPSTHEIQAVEKTDLLVVNFKEYRQLIKGHICWQEINRQVLEGLLLEKENREFEFLTMQAGERYKIFLERYSDIVTRIPQYYIASYLGIDPASLNRVIRKMSSKNGTDQE